MAIEPRSCGAASAAVPFLRHSQRARRTRSAFMRLWQVTNRRGWDSRAVLGEQSWSGSQMYTNKSEIENARAVVKILPRGGSAGIVTGVVARACGGRIFAKKLER